MLSLEQTGILVAIAVAVIGLLNSILVQGTRFAKMEVKVDTLWDFLIRRAGVEAVAKGLATVNSPIKLLPHAIAKLEPLRADLVKVFNSLPHPVKDSDLLFEIERQLGMRLVKEVCMPHQWSMGECLFAAAAMAKDDPTITLPDLIL